MNKSLKVLLEQPKKKPTAQPSEPAQQNTPTNNTQTPITEPTTPAPVQPAARKAGGRRRCACVCVCMCMCVCVKQEAASN